MKNHYYLVFIHRKRGFGLRRGFCEGHVADFSAIQTRRLRYRHRQVEFGKRVNRISIRGDGNFGPLGRGRLNETGRNNGTGKVLEQVLAI